MNDLRRWMTLCESQAVLYHVTRTANLPKIAREGLVPKLGVRARKLGEPRPAIYFFPSKDDAENAIENWLGDEFSETTRLALLAITIPPNIPIHSDVEYERHVYEPIPPEAITVLDRNFGY